MGSSSMGRLKSSVSCGTFLWRTGFFIFQISMNVRSEPTTVADTLCAPTQRGASSAAAVPGGLEMALSAQVNWNSDRSCVHELCGLETWNCSFYKVKVNLCITRCKCRGTDNDVNFVLKIWTSALMEPTCAANMQTVRTPWGRTAVSVRTATRAMASPAQVGLLWKQLCSSCWKAEHPTSDQQFFFKTWACQSGNRNDCLSEIRSPWNEWNLGGKSPSNLLKVNTVWLCLFACLSLYISHLI